MHYSGKAATPALLTPLLVADSYAPTPWTSPCILDVTCIQMLHSALDGLSLGGLSTRVLSISGAYQKPQHCHFAAFIMPAEHGAWYNSRLL